MGPRFAYMQGDTNPQGVGPVVRRLRIEAGLYQHELAERVRLSQAHISRIETGALHPNAVLVTRLAKALGVDRATLTGSAA